MSLICGRKRRGEEKSASRRGRKCGKQGRIFMPEIPQSTLWSSYRRPFNGGFVWCQNTTTLDFAHSSVRCSSRRWLPIKHKLLVESLFWNLIILPFYVITCGGMRAAKKKTGSNKLIIRSNKFHPLNIQVKEMWIEMNSVTMRKK